MRLPSLFVFRCIGQVLLGQLTVVLTTFTFGGCYVAVLAPDVAVAKRSRTRQHDLVHLAQAVESYRQREGFRPEKLDDLVTGGILAPLPLDAWGRPFRYERSATGMRLWSLGPDGLQGGELPPATGPADAELIAHWNGGPSEGPQPDDLGCRVDDTFTPPDLCR